MCHRIGIFMVFLGFAPFLSGPRQSSGLAQERLAGGKEKGPDEAILKKAREALGGSWSFVLDADGNITKGKVDFFPEGAKGSILIEFYVPFGDKPHRSSMKLHGFNDKAKPMQIDVLDRGAAPADEGKVQLGIVEIKKDQLHFCIARAGKKRPADFKFVSREETSYYWILKREK